MLQVSAGVRFGPGQATRRPAALFAASVSSGGSVIVDRRSARPARHRIARRGLAVERQVQDLAERLARVLRRREALPLAASSGTATCRRARRRCVAPNWPPSPPAGSRQMTCSPSSRGSAAVADQLGPRQREAAAAVRRRLGIGQIDELVGGEVGRNATSSSPPWLRHDDPRSARDRLLAAGRDVDQPDAARLLGDERVS